MHCDDKRTIYALNKSLAEALEEKEILLRKLNDQNSLNKTKIEDQVKSLEKYIKEVEDQLSKIP